MKVSIVIASVSGESALNNCLASIRQLEDSYHLEIIVERGDPESVFELRARGIIRASGERIAVVGDRYEVTAAWMKALFAEHSFDLVGGCVAPGPQLTYWGWCVYLTEYAHVSPPIADGTIRDPKLVPGGNAAYNAALVRRIKPRQTDTDLTLHARLLQSGAKTGLLNDFEVLFTSPHGCMEYVRERFWYSFTIARGKRPGWSLFQAPLLPFVVLMRTGAVAFRKGRFIRFLSCVPVIACLAAAQGIGEFAGSLKARKKRAS